MAELRIVVSGDQDVKRVLADIRSQGRTIRQELALAAKDGGSALKKELSETRKEADRLEKYLKAVDQEAKRGLTVTIGQARRLFQSCNQDVNQLKYVLQQAGVKTADIKILTQQLTRELKESRREAMGLDGNMNRLKDSIKTGAFQAGAMTAAFEKAKAAVEAMTRLGKVKGLEDSTADAIELQKQYDKLQTKLGLANDPKTFAQVRKNIEDTSIRSNVSQSSLIKSVNLAQETKSAGRELALDNGGALLSQLAMTSYGDYQDEGEIPDSVKAQIILMKNLKLSGAGQLQEVQNITTAGEQQGALTAKDVATKGGGIISQLMQLQGTAGIPAYRKGQALLQTLGDAPGVDGDIDRVKVLGENLIAKLTDPNTRDRLKEAAGVETLDKEGKLRDLPTIMAELAVSQKGGKFAIPESDEDLRKAEADPKKATKFKDFFEIFKDMQAREAVIAVYRSRQKLSELENVDASVGAKMLEEGFQKRINSPEGQLDQIARRDERTHAQKLGEKFNYIRTGADAVSRTQAEHPLYAGAASIAGDVAGIAGPKAKLAVEAGLAVVPLALGASDGGVPRHDMTVAAEQAAIKKAQEATKRSEQNIAEMKAKMAAMGGATVNLVVNVQEGMTATVTSDAKTSKGAARGNTRQPKPGQR